MNITAILTTHNRKSLTVTCLHKLLEASIIANVSLDCVLVDDGSSDGTVEAVEEIFEWVTVIKADGSLFWCRGMHLGFAEAMKRESDLYLWINDDTHIYPDALLNTINTWKQLQLSTKNHVVLSGPTKDQENGKITYGGGVAKSKLRKFTFSSAYNSDQVTACDVANGNFLLIPKFVAERVGNLDPAYEHALGDIDYTLRVKKLGFELYVSPYVIGTCSHNLVTNTYLDPSLGFFDRFKKMLSRKGLPIKSWYHFTNKHAGFFSLLYFFWPYLKFIVTAFSPKQ